MQNINVEDLTAKLQRLSPRVYFPPVILCIGSDRVTGDCLGPLVGHLLQNVHNTSAYVYGTLDSPVNALNLVKTLDFVLSHHIGSYIIAVDSSLGHKSDIGKIHVINGGIFPGVATGKVLPRVGDVGITATVATLDNSALYGVSLGFVHKLSLTIAAAVSASVNKSYLCAACLQ